MSDLSHLLDGLVNVLTPQNLLLALAGCVLGMLVGILPGFGPAAGTAVLLPVTFALDPTGAIIMLAAIMYGSAYGGTITAVLLNIPGETSSVATTIDGYQMALKGRAGPALSIAAIGSFVGCLFGLVGFVAAIPLTDFALEFGPAETFAITLCALALLSGLTSKSLVKALISAALGLAIALPGLDPSSGVPRFTFGIPQLFDGFSLIAVVMGLFGLSELFTTIDRRTRSGRAIPVGRILPTSEDLRRSAAPIARGSVIGFLFGLLPGSPGATASFASYVTEKRFSKRRDEFGHGAVEGVAGPETTNNSMAISVMIPLFTLGLPTSATTAILLGAFQINGLTPGPLLFRDNSEIAWTIIASMLVGNIILLFLNIPLVRVWVLLLRIPFPVLYVFVVGFMTLGAYTIDNSVFNVGVMWAFGVLGYLLRKVDIPLAPMALTIVVAHVMEVALRQALAISGGSLSILVSTPLAATLMAVAALALVGPAVAGPISRRRLARQGPPPAEPEPTTEDSDLTPVPGKEKS